MRQPSVMRIDHQKRLGRLVSRRRIDLGYTSRKAFAEASGIGERTVADLEQGKSVSFRTMHLAEKALLWGSGSCDDVLMGGEPTIVDDGDTPPPNPALEALTAALELVEDDDDLDDLLAHLRDAVAKRRRATQNVNPGRRSNTAG